MKKYLNTDERCDGPDLEVKTLRADMDELRRALNELLPPEMQITQAEA